MTTALATAPSRLSASASIDELLAAANRAYENVRVLRGLSLSGLTSDEVDQAQDTFERSASMLFARVDIEIDALSGERLAALAECLRPVPGYLASLALGDSSAYTRRIYDDVRARATASPALEAAAA